VGLLVTSAISVDQLSVAVTVEALHHDTLGCLDNQIGGFLADALNGTLTFSVDLLPSLLQYPPCVVLRRLLCLLKDALAGAVRRRNEPLSLRSGILYLGLGLG
jgi:hypothetical protein